MGNSRDERMVDGHSKYLGRVYQLKKLATDLVIKSSSIDCLWSSTPPDGVDHFEHALLLLSSLADHGFSSWDCGIDAYRYIDLIPYRGVGAALLHRTEIGGWFERAKWLFKLNSELEPNEMRAIEHDQG